MIAAAVAAAFAGHAMAAITADEAKKLGGAEYNEVGALKAGNKDGTIPAYSGKPPATAAAPASAGKFKAGDPYASEKPLYSIDAKNMDKYADKLSEGVKTLMRRYASFRIDVYPTHRDQYFPQHVLENTPKCATATNTVGEGTGLTGPGACIPFPLPKNGYEVMWNANLRHRAPFQKANFRIWSIDSAGTLTLSSENEVLSDSQWWNPKNKNPVFMQRLLNENLAPAAKNGSKDLRVTPLRMDQDESRAWSYIPGQRRVRLAPEFKYDTVSTSTGGLILFDEIALFDGKMDRFDFSNAKLKEIYVPFDSVKSQHVSAEVLAAPKTHPDPNYIRWELRRVWEVDAPRKEGARHIYKKKVFYVDADAWTFVLYDSFDQSGKIYRTAVTMPWYDPDSSAVRAETNAMWDLNKGIWGLIQHYHDRAQQKVESLPDSTFSPDALAGSGLR
jgi:hypothetical protein